MLSVGSLFSGCGGLDLGLHYADLDLVWACEADTHAAAVLRRHWPAIAVAPDVREIDAGFPAVDVLAGGFPCQDVSHAGLRAGLADGTRSGLWFEFSRAIRILRPRFVIVENVPGLFTAGFGLVMADLAEAGYDASWACLRASDFGAPHRRERVFVVATDASVSGAGWDGRAASQGEEQARWGQQDQANVPESRPQDAADADDRRREQHDARLLGERLDASEDRSCLAPRPSPQRSQVVRLRFCAHPACHRLVKGLPGALCIYHQYAMRDAD